MYPIIILSVVLSGITIGIFFFRQTPKGVTVQVSITYIKLENRYEWKVLLTGLEDKKNRMAMPKYGEFCITHKWRWRARMKFRKMLKRAMQDRIKLNTKSQKTWHFYRFR